MHTFYQKVKKVKIKSFRQNLNNNERFTAKIYILNIIIKEFIYFYSVLLLLNTKRV